MPNQVAKKKKEHKQEVPEEDLATKEARVRREARTAHLSLGIQGRDLSDRMRKKLL